MSPTWGPTRCWRVLGSGNEGSQDLIENAYLMLDPQLQPIQPSTSCMQSVKVFEEHKKLAQEFLKVQTEVALLTKYKNELADKLTKVEELHQVDPDPQDIQREVEEFVQLQSERESLVQLHRNLKLQLERIKIAQQRQRNRTLANTTTNDDGWIMVHRQT